MRNLAYAVCALSFLSYALPSSACLNNEEQYPPAPSPENIVRSLTQRPPREHWEDAVARLRAKPPAVSDWVGQNNYAVALVHLGENQQAFEILKDVEARHPQEYRTAANLGTVYELLGNNEEALHWIKEGIQRNPESHQGSEWLHVRILEAKIAQSRDETWLQTNSVTGMDFGSDSTPVSPAAYPKGNKGQALNADAVAAALKYQLHERLEFIKPPDAVVSDLLFDLANLRLLKFSSKEALPVYEMAWQYNPAQTDLVRSRLEAAGGHIGWPAWLKVLLFGSAAALFTLRVGAGRRKRV